MRIRLTAEPTGIYGAKGQFPTGTELDVKKVPAGWAGRYVVISGGPKDGSVAINNEPPALSGKNKAQLLEIAANEGVTVEDDATNDDIKAAIELKREADAK